MSIRFALPVMATVFVGVASASPVGVPIPEALADKPMPLPIYEFAEEPLYDLGHKNVPVPGGYGPAVIVPISYKVQGFKGLGAYNDPAEVILGLDDFHAWKKDPAALRD
ncbi:MAG: hypothetical protein AAF830_16800 [Pseudomonadota bacterium]